MDLNAWERRAHGGDDDAGRGRNEDFERTVGLGGPGADGAMGETLPLHAAGQGRGAVPAARQGGEDEPYYGYADDPYGAVPGFGPDEGGYGGEGYDGGDGGRPGPGRRGLSRRVLFAAGGLTLVGGGGIAAAAVLRSHPAAAPAALSTPRKSAPPTPQKSPADLSSSAATAPSPPPPDVANPGSGVDAARVQTAPEYYVHAGPKVVALTLDDGPSPIYTPQVLDLLEQLRIKATFCMIGRQVAANHSLVSEVAAAGHLIVNHTWDHADQSRLSLTRIRSEISRTSDTLASVGIQPSVFRAPYGAWSHAVYEACAMANLRPLDWSVDPQDWSRPGTATIVSRILSHTRTGSIILEHDGGGDRSQTVAALKIVLPKLLAAGYRFTTV